MGCRGLRVKDKECFSLAAFIFDFIELQLRLGSD